MASSAASPQPSEREGHEKNVQCREEGLAIFEVAGEQDSGVSFERSAQGAVAREEQPQFGERGFQTPCGLDGNVLTLFMSEGA